MYICIPLLFNNFEMDFNLLYQVLYLMEEFENFSNEFYEKNINGFKRWIYDEQIKSVKNDEPNWEGKESGRSAESVISTLLVHLNKYAKSYSKSLMYNSPFSSQDDFIFLINLKIFGPMTKMELIKKNIHDKPSGIQIINRLIRQGWVTQRICESDKRRKVIELTDDGFKILDRYMDKIRIATNIVSGNLIYSEKMQLINILNKLNFFHKQIFDKNVIIENLLDVANEKYLTVNKI